MTECWKCLGKGTVEEPVCGWCEEGVVHSSCDDTWQRTVKCDACSEEKGAELSNSFVCSLFFCFVTSVILIVFLRNCGRY
jgi:hypothetical protein